MKEKAMKYMSNNIMHKIAQQKSNQNITAEPDLLHIDKKSLTKSGNGFSLSKNQLENIIKKNIDKEFQKVN